MKPPSRRNSSWPNGTRSTKIANATWRTRAYPMTRQLIARRLWEKAYPIPMMSAMPIKPVRRVESGVDPVGVSLN